MPVLKPTQNIVLRRPALRRGVHPAGVAPSIGTSRQAGAASLDLANQLFLWLGVLFLSCVGLVALTRVEPLAVIVISLLVPAVLIATGALRFAIPRTAQLFAITSYFMVVSTIAIVAVALDWTTLNRVAGFAFFGYFALQIAGFLADQIKKKSATGFASTVFGGTAIILWGASTDLISGFDENGLFQIWGENAPAYIQAIYCLWVVQVIVDMRTLPKLTEASAHVASVTVAVLSGQFFFARLLTASQIFMMDGLLRCTDRNFGGANFLVVPDDSLSKFRSGFRRYASPALFAALMIVATLSCRDSLGRMGLL